MMLKNKKTHDTLFIAIQFERYDFKYTSLFVKQCQSVSCSLDVLLGDISYALQEEKSSQTS